MYPPSLPIIAHQPADASAIDKRVALANAAINTDRDGPAIGESAGGIMTGTARHRPVGRKAAVKKQLLAKRDFVWRLRVVSGDRLASELNWETDLVERFRLGQRTCFGNGTRLGGGWSRRFVPRGSRLRARLFANRLHTETQRSGGCCCDEPDAQSSSLCGGHFIVGARDR
jgi:hypothetical protein